MNTPCNLPYFEVEINKEGVFVEDSQLAAILNYLNQFHDKVKDLFVISHGWNNDEDEARSLYERFFTQFCGVLAQNAQAGVSAQQFAVVGILWPSKKFADTSLIPGGAAALDADSDLEHALDQIAEILGTGAVSKVEKARALLPSLADDPVAQNSFVEAVLSLLPNVKDKEEGTHELFSVDGSELLERLSTPLILGGRNGDLDEGGGASIGGFRTLSEEGSAQGLGSILEGIKGAAMRLLNFTTYYVMKERAGKVGVTGVAELLRRIQSAFPTIRIHLIGHSFGARVVTSAAASILKPVDSMLLLQAAFSHNAFSADFDSSHTSGAFRAVITAQRIRGPLVITHSVKDLAVGLAYAVASRVARQNGSAIGDANDPYGGLGRNGAQHTEEATNSVLLEAGKHYAFTPGGIANLKADDIIMGHSDIAKNQTAYALLAAAGLAK